METRYVNGEMVHPSYRVTAEDEVYNNITASMCNLPFRDADAFVPGVFMNVYKNG